MAAPGESAAHTIGSKVWVRDDGESWLKAEVLKVGADGTLTVRTATGQEKKQLKADDCPLQNPDIGANKNGVEVRRRGALDWPGEGREEGWGWGGGGGEALGGAAVVARSHATWLGRRMGAPGAGRMQRGHVQGWRGVAILLQA